MNILMNITTHLEALCCFTKTDSFYYFGCSNGVLICNYFFKNIKRVKSEKWVFSIASIRNELVILGEYRGPIEIIDARVNIII